MKAPPLRRSVVLTACYDSYNVGHPNWPPGKSLPTNSESESPQAPKYGAITVIGEASGDEDGGEMPEQPGSVDLEIEENNDLSEEVADIEEASKDGDEGRCRSRLIPSNLISRNPMTR